MADGVRDAVVIVTGAGRGIGREVAVEFARAGRALVLVSRTAGQLDEVAASIRSGGGTALAVPADVTDAEQVDHVRAVVMDEFGRADTLVNNAGASYVANVAMSDDRQWRGVIETNVLGVYLCTKAFLRPMIRDKRGQIINVASVAGLVGAAYNSAYAASKAAVIGFTKSVAREVAGLGISVNAICPWHVETALSTQTMAARGKMFGKNAEEYLADVVAESPQRRLISTTEVASLALFLASPGARGITGQAINLSGGAVWT